MSNIEHWIGVRMTAGYDDEDFRDLMRMVNTMRSVAEAVVVESAEVPQPREGVPKTGYDFVSLQLAGAVDDLREARHLLSGDLDGGALGDARKLLDIVLQRFGGQ